MVTRRVSEEPIVIDLHLGQGWNTQLVLIWLECSRPASSLTRRVTSSLLRFAIKVSAIERY